MIMKNIAIIGSTGSIGQQTLEVIRDNYEKFHAELLIANNNADLLIKQALQFKPKTVVIANEDLYDYVKEALSNHDIEVCSGKKAIEETIVAENIDIVVTACVGFSGLVPTIKAIEANKIIALANKETLVVAGKLINELLKESNSKIIPVDSEHSAIFQCLTGEKSESIERLILTASGGPFRNYDLNALEKVTPQEALKHPNWNMGNKVTIDSASLMNKGLEVIEAHWLFGVSWKNIDVIIHPQSVIHSMVEFKDGSIKAQMGIPTMKLPIHYALNYPERTTSHNYKLSFEKYNTLTFEAPNRDVFRNLNIAYYCLKKSGNYPCILNAANEIAVESFLNERIKFTDIPEIIEKIIPKIDYIKEPSLQDYFNTNNITRIKTLERIKKLK